MAGAGGFGQDPSQIAKDQAAPEVTKAAGETQQAQTPPSPTGGEGTPGAGGMPSSPMAAMGVGAGAGIGPGAKGSQAKAKEGADAKEEAPELGAGGTSEKDNPEGSEPQLPGGGGAGKAAAATAAAAPAAAKVAMLMVFLNWLKTLFAMMAAVLANLWGMIVAAIMAVVKAVVGFFVGLGAGIASAFGGAVSAMAGAVSSFFGFITAAVVGVAVTVGVVQTHDLNKHDALPEPCEASVVQAVSASGDGTVDEAAQTQANAQTVYSVLAAWGMSDESIAGVLGNWSAESGIDPTGVETIFDEKFRIGDRKLDAEAKGFKIADVNPEYAATYPAIDLMGIGLGQWTNGRNALLREYAEGIDQPWHALETQLGFMISHDDPVRVQQIKDMIAGSYDGADSVSGATMYFMQKWEGLTSGNLATRTEKASSWFAQMGGWATNQTLADSILAQSGTAIDGADKAAVNKALSECVGSKLNVDNSSLATAMASYAWPMYDDSKGNDGTYLYVWLHEEILPGDPYFASCDRSVATGVRWSGSDDTFPAATVQAQLNYVSTSDKWEGLDWGGDKANLQPGDILMRKDPDPNGVSHIVMYVGPDVPLQVWGEGNFTPNAEIASGSLNDRSPALGQWYGASSGHGTVSGGGRGLDTYTAWRLKAPEASSKYSSIVPPDTATMGDGDKTRMTTPGGR